MGGENYAAANNDSKYTGGSCYVPQPYAGKRAVHRQGHHYRLE